MGMRCAAACPLACLRVSLRVRTGGDPVRIQSQPRAGEGVSSRRGGAPFPTCILAALRPVLFAAAACERVRWRRRAGGRLGLPAALGVSRERRYCPPAPPSPLCSSGHQTVAWFAATWQKRRHSAVAATCWRCVSNPSVRSCERRAVVILLSIIPSHLLRRGGPRATHSLKKSEIDTNDNTFVLRKYCECSVSDLCVRCIFI